MDAGDLIVAEALLNHAVMENMERTQRGQTGGIGDKTTPLQSHGIANFDFAL